MWPDVKVSDRVRAFYDRCGERVRDERWDALARLGLSGPKLAPGLACLLYTSPSPRD